MAIHNFTFAPRKVTELGAEPESAPLVQNLDIRDEEFITTLYDNTNVDNSEELRYTAHVGFKPIDRGLKDWLSDIKVPTKDGIRSEPAMVRIAGGDKTILIWKQEILDGRIKLPVISINRETAQFNPQKFSPPYAPTSRVILGEGDRVREAFRPHPYLIDYTISMWAERKRDIEYMLTQVMTRMNPLATIQIEDLDHCGTMVIKFNSYTDSSDIDIGADEIAKVRYDISITVEGYIPVAHTIIKKTVLGRVATLHEMTGDFLEVLDVASNPGISSFTQGSREE